MPLTPSPWWHPRVHAARRPFLQARARIAAAVRGWFDAAGFVEVETPALQISPGMEPHIMAFATDFVGSNPDDRQRFYLHTSPEFAMKKLLVAGEPKIFQLARVYRNGEVSPTHHPEFTMLEWYRADAGYHDLVDDCAALVQAALRAAGRDHLSRGDVTCDPFADWEILTVPDAFIRYAGIDLLATAPDPLNPDTELLAKAAAGIGINAHEGDRWEDIFFRISLDRIEPNLGMGRPTVLTDYPISMAALARPKPSDPRLAERFEAYCCGVELCNAFGELTNPVAQRARFIADMDLKEQLYGTRYPVDEDFLAALEVGLPESTGIALGFDRLVMLCTGAGDLTDVLWAPVAVG